MKKIITILILAILSLSCIFCLTACVVDLSQEKEEHTHSYSEEVVLPTCTEKGYTLHKCACGDEYKDSYVEKEEHNFVSGACEGCGKKQPSEGLSYTLINDDTEYKVSGIGTCEDDDLVIPDFYEGKPVTEIGDTAFIACGSFSFITIGENVTKIGERAFSGCNSLCFVNVPDNVTQIDSQAFAYCNKLCLITVGNGVTQIGKYAFSYCDSLYSVWLGSSVSTIEEYVLYGSDSIRDITVDINNQSFKSKNGNLYSKDGKILIQYAIGKTATEFIIPNGVTKIGESAFDDCKSIESVVLPNGLTVIDKYAFGGCDSLLDISIPDSVTLIDGFAFFDCDNLCSATIGKGVTQIGNYAFYSCDVMSDLTFNGTKEEWNGISKGEYWNANISATVVHCSDGDIDI